MNDTQGSPEAQQPYNDDAHDRHDGTPPPTVPESNGASPQYGPGTNSQQSGAAGTPSDSGQPRPYQPYPQPSYGQPQEGYAPYGPQPDGTYYGDQTFAQGQPAPRQPYGPGQHFPPQGAYYPPAPNDQWNILCIIGFIISFPIPLVGMILSIIALVQINRSHEKSKGMAIAGIVVGAVQTIVWTLIVGLVLWGVGMYMDHGGQWDDTDSSCISGDCSQQSGKATSHTVRYIDRGYQYTAHLTNA